MLDRLAVVGTGLIGTSVGLAAKRAGTGSVVAFDPDERSLVVAVERGAADGAAETLEEAVGGASLVVVAAPVSQLPALVPTVLAAGDATVTDVGSTKGAVSAAAAGNGRFVGGHPMCGSESRGPEHATADLFEGATWFLTPVAETDPASLRRVHGFVSALGATPVAIEPETHDRVVALTSHLPHALANLLVNQAGANRVEGHDPLAAAGGSLREMTRVAGANPRIWVDIFLENAGVLGEASSNRRRLLAQAFPDPGALQQLHVHVPDRPGVLAGITQALGAARINIEDFELQHVSTDRGGNLTLLVTGEDAARRAADLLEEQGYGVVVEPVLE